MCGNRHKVLANFNNSAFCFSAMLSDNLAPIVLITLLSFVFLQFKVDILESINLCGTFSTEFAMNCWMFGQAEGNMRMTVIHLMSP